MQHRQDNAERYETDEEIREQAEGSAPEISREPVEPSGGDWTVGGPKDDHGHGDIDDDEASTP